MDAELTLIHSDSRSAERSFIGTAASCNQGRHLQDITLLSHNFTRPSCSISDATSLQHEKLLFGVIMNELLLLHENFTVMLSLLYSIRHFIRCRTIPLNLE